MSQEQNDNLVLISGESSTGKSASLMNMKNPEGVMYLNCEAGKKLPFKSKFEEYKISDPYQVYDAFTAAEERDDIHTIVIDTQTYLMDMFESLHVINSTNTMQGWGNYAQYFKNLMQQYVGLSTKNVCMLAHTRKDLNEATMSMETKVPVKGSLANTGIESFFSTVVSTKKVSLKNLKDYDNDLLVITPQEEALGFKYVFQTQITKDTVNERIRGPMGLWEIKETFIDNDVSKLFSRLHEYYD